MAWLQEGCSEQACPGQHSPELLKLGLARLEPGREAWAVLVLLPRATYQEHTSPQPDLKKHGPCQAAPSKWILFGLSTSVEEPRAGQPLLLPHLT